MMQTSDERLRNIVSINVSSSADIIISNSRRLSVLQATPRVRLASHVEDHINDGSKVGIPSLAFCIFSSREDVLLGSLGPIRR